MYAGRLPISWGVWPTGSAAKIERPAWVIINTQTVSNRTELAVNGIALLDSMEEYPLYRVPRGTGMELTAAMHERRQAYQQYDCMDEARTRN